MSLETASYVANLISTNPDGADARNTADDHIRLIKAALTRTFPKLDGAVSLSSVQYAFLNDVSASVQSQLNSLRDGPATANYAVNARFANSASLALYANSASFATLAATANSASFAVLAGTATLALTANSASYAALAGTATVALTANSASYAALAGLAAAATLATTATNATNATTAATATNALALNGLSSDAAATGSTIAARNSSGEIFAYYFHQGSTIGESVSIGHVAVMTNADGYWRIVSMALLGQYVSAQNITGRAGTSKTITSGNGPPSLSGSTNGDVFYYY
jgi:hypothetical protein